MNEHILLMVAARYRSIKVLTVTLFLEAKEAIGYSAEQL